MSDVELFDPISRDVLIYDQADVAAALAANTNLRVPSADEIRQYDDRKALGGNELLAGAEKLAGAATFGAIDKLSGTDDEAAARKRGFEREHNIAAPALELGGSLVPTLAASALTGGGAPALGLGARAAGLAATVAEGAAGGLAMEAERTRQTDEAIDYWNALAWGVGGNVLGHGLGLAARGALGELDNVLGRAERRALASDAKSARALEKGPERTEAFARSGTKIADDIVEEAAPELDRVTKAYAELSDLGNYRAKIDEIAPEVSPTAREWAKGTSSFLTRNTLDLELPAAERKVFDQALDTLASPESEAADIVIDGSRAIQALADVPQAGFARDMLVKGVEDTALFGQAAELAGKVHRAAPSLAQPAALDAKALKKLVTGDVLETKAARAGVDRLLADVDTLADVHKAFQTGAGGEVPKALEAVRRGLLDADEARVAQASRSLGPDAAPGLLSSATAYATKNLGETAATAAGAALGHATGIPGGGLAGGVLARKGYEALIQNMSGAQRAATARAARGFVRGASRTIEASRPVAAPMSGQILELFRGDYDSPESSYEAKLAGLQATINDPMLLAKVIGRSFGELPTVLPKAYGKVSAQMARAQAFLVDNLPVSVAATMVSPRGLPPSKQTIREFALLWNSVTSPETVLHSLEEGTAVPLQIEALKAVHPEDYARLRNDIMGEIARAPEQIPTQTKLWMDILFDMDGAAGLAYSWEAGLAFREPQEQPLPRAGEPKTKPSEPSAPAGITAMKSGPTSGGYRSAQT